MKHNMFESWGKNLLEYMALLSHRKRVAFAASCCERMLPNYVAFSRQVGWGDPVILRAALDEIWRYVEKDRVDLLQVNILINSCGQNIPDTEQFSHQLTSAALDASAGISETLRCIVDRSADPAADVGAMALDTVQMYVRDLEKIDPETVQGHPLLQAEFDCQAKALTVLSRTGDLSPESIKNLRHENEGKSNIGLDVACDD